MNWKHRMAVTAVSLIACGGLLAAEKPNIILAMADDMGWGDLSSYGNKRVPTPHIDLLAKQGIQLTQYYAASAVCTPTRASVLTGRYPLRFNITRHFGDDGEFLPQCVTLPKLLQAAGYQTAHVGKWHLGGLRLKDSTRRDQVPGPHQHGFDHYLAQNEEQPLRGNMGAARTLYRKGGTCLLRDDMPVGKDDPYYPMYLTDIYADESVRLVKKFHAEGKPFLLNLWWLTPHTPYEPAPEPQWSQTAADNISENQHCFRSMMARMDWNFGKLLKTLDELGITNNTLVIFTSDNGGAWEANIGDLAGGKTDLHEGGIRVACLARWPGTIKPASVSDALCHSTDLLPTLCAAAGAALPKDGKFDGMNVLPLLSGQTQHLKRDTLFWQIHHYPKLQRHQAKSKPYATEIARKGEWKLLAKDGVPVELFNIDKDLLEKDNLLEKHPDIASSLAKELKAWLAEPREQFGDVPN